MEHIIVDTKDGVRTLTLNRPERLNAVNDTLSHEIIQAISEASSDDEVRVIVITGSGRGFCAGLDLTEYAKRNPDLQSRHQKLDDLGWVGHQALGIVHCDKPVIAAINGIAAGAGLALALACDIRFMSADARVTAGYIRRGLSPDAGMSYFLPRLVGQAKAAELIYTGRDIYPEEAERLGLVNGVFADEDLHEQVMNFARELAAGPPVAMTLSKRLLASSQDSDLTAILKQEYAFIKQCFGTKDVQEGIRAFAEKRKPVFRGE
ncbi:enoyl-CoA hydratase/isomerase family protein [Mesobacillus maritimus]|uniref:enoyl-CoA hydratase/isomerase family protein n=1 Tax=Mesobacillus maritimus TaxID=1643336 RepID=UPI00203BA233|nr:enoyl-CoA hydratase/isomerase family protein [Mesobacillus maritimus]MCM3584696.1 enoyl-CoA hydratase/isomerase family protein [Mesobacillus maritimus]MCM3671296.1 enoyl-CoA hydratase/isomerase family protein [Mesobacillus maritimus]